MAPLPLRMSWKSVTARRPIFFGRRSLHTYIFIYFAAYINGCRRSAGGLSWSLHTHYEDSWALPIEFSQNQVSTERSRKVEQRQMCLENRVSDLKILKIFACGAQEGRLATLACYPPLRDDPRHLGGSAAIPGTGQSSGDSPALRCSWRAVNLRVVSNLPLICLFVDSSTAQAQC